MLGIFSAVRLFSIFFSPKKYFQNTIRMSNSLLFAKVTVFSEIFVRILFSQLALKDIFAMSKFATRPLFTDISI